MFNLLCRISDPSSKQDSEIKRIKFVLASYSVLFIFSCPINSISEDQQLKTSYKEGIPEEGSFFWHKHL